MGPPQTSRAATCKRKSAPHACTSIKSPRRIFGKSLSWNQVVSPQGRLRELVAITAVRESPPDKPPSLPPRRAKKKTGSSPMGIGIRQIDGPLQLTARPSSRVGYMTTLQPQVSPCASPRRAPYLRLRIDVACGPCETGREKNRVTKAVRSTA